jgi:hypothetical protein
MYVPASLSLSLAVVVVVGVRLTCAQTPDVAKSILADAVKAIPRSVKIWLAATRLEALVLFVSLSLSVSLMAGWLAGGRQDQAAHPAAGARVCPELGQALARTLSQFDPLVATIYCLCSFLV